MFGNVLKKYIQRSFFNKIILIYSAITVCSIILLTSIILFSFSQTLEERELRLNSQIITKISQYLDIKFKNALVIYQDMYSASQSSNIRALSFFGPARELTREHELKAKAELAEKLATGIRQDADIYDIVIRRYDSDGSDDWFIMENRNPVIREPYLPPKEFFSGDLESNRGFIMIPAHSPEYRNYSRNLPVQVYTMAEEIYSIDLSQRIGQIYIEYDTQGIRNNYREYSKNLKGYILVLSESGDVLFDSSNRYYGQKYPYFDKLMSGKPDLELESDSAVNIMRPAQGKLIVAGIIPKTEIYTVSNTIRKTVYLVSFACIFASILLSYLTTNVTSRRVKAITDAMKKLRKGDLSTRISIKPREDEIGEIASSFNRMCDDLQSYINKVYLAEIRQKTAQLDALQSQINPHFIYNTLEVIRMRAISKGDEDAGDMIQLLAALFRRTIRDDKIITVREEIDYCSMYLDLFKIRYGDKMASSVTVSEEVLTCGIMKHILQPIIENYIVHGFDPDRDNNRISITGESVNGDLLFTIEDNGKGLKPKRIQEIKEGLYKSGSDNIGLTNINERIRLIYGEDYGIVIDDSIKKGCRIIIRMKRMSVEELRKCTES